MADDFDDAPETRDTPHPSEAAAVHDPDEEPAETRETPPRGAPQQADQATPQAATQAAADEALAALEGNALYQTLPPGYKRMVLAGRSTVEEAVAQRNRQLIIKGQTTQKALAAEQKRAAEAIQSLEATYKQSVADLEAKMGQRLERMLRQLTGEPEPEEKPAGPVDPRDALLQGMAEKLEGLTAVQLQQFEDQAVRREMAAVEEYSAADVERAVQAVPWYEQAEEFVQQQAFTAELAAINDAYPELSDAQAEQLAARRVMEMASTLMVEARQKGVSLAAEVIGMAQKLGFRPQAAGAAPAAPSRPPAPKPGSSAARLLDQQRREQGVVGPTTGARGTGGASLAEMSKDLAARALTMSDEDFADFIGDGKEGDRRLRQIVSQRAE